MLARGPERQREGSRQASKTRVKGGRGDETNMWECVAIREDRSEDEAAGVTFMTLCMKEVEAGQRRGKKAGGEDR